MDLSHHTRVAWCITSLLFHGSVSTSSTQQANICEAFSLRPLRSLEFNFRLKLVQSKCANRSVFVWRKQRAAGRARPSKRCKLSKYRYWTVAFLIRHSTMFHNWNIVLFWCILTHSNNSSCFRSLQDMTWEWRLTQPWLLTKPRLRDLNTCDRIQETSFAYMELLQVVLFLFCLCSGFCFYSIHIQIFSSEILTLSHGSSFYEWLKDSERKLNIMIVCIYLLIKCLKEGDMHVVTQHTGSVAQISTWFIDWSLQ